MDSKEVKPWLSISKMFLRSSHHFWKNVLILTPLIFEYDYVQNLVIWTVIIHLSLIKSLSPVNQICLPGGHVLGWTAFIQGFWVCLF